MARATTKTKQISNATQAAAVNAYLELLTERKKPRGRRTCEFLERRLSQIDAELNVEGVKPTRRVDLTQEHLDVLADLKAMNTEGLIEDAKVRFVEVAAAYSERKGISYAAWRGVGVPVEVLEEAGIQR